MHRPTGYPLGPGLFGHGEDAQIPDDTTLDEAAWALLVEVVLTEHSAAVVLPLMGCDASET